jgi:hypothetical protein
MEIKKVKADTNSVACDNSQGNSKGARDESKA